MLIYGKGFEKDTAQGALLFRKAAKRGHAAAQRRLGTSILRGRGEMRQGRPLDITFIFQLHCSALCYEQGKGVVKNLHKAFRSA